MGNTMQADDIDAINVYIMQTQAVTPEATKLKDSWIKWFNDLSWYSKDLSLDTYDEARNRRNAFNIANAPTAVAKAQVKAVVKGGLTSEESAGRASRLNSEGKFPEEDKPLIPTPYKVVGAIALLGGVLAFAWEAPHAIANAIFRRK